MGQGDVIRDDDRDKDVGGEYIVSVGVQMNAMVYDVDLMVVRWWWAMLYDVLSMKCFQTMVGEFV